VSTLSSGQYKGIEKDDDPFGACYVLPFMACLLLAKQLLLLEFLHIDELIFSDTGLVDKIGDTKQSKAVMGCLTAFCEAVGPQFVFSRVGGRPCSMMHAQDLFYDQLSSARALRRKFLCIVCCS
jgi:hypothetical protein